MNRATLTLTVEQNGIGLIARDATGTVTRDGFFPWDRYGADMAWRVDMSVSEWIAQNEPAVTA